MKLRTSLTASRDGSLVDATDENLIQDAAAAHALMMAMDEFYAAPLDSTLTTPEDAINWLEWRASEIMAQWDFDSGGGGVMDWQTIESAPQDSGLLVVYMPDTGDGERFDFDYREDGVWVVHAESYEHFMMVGGANAAGPDCVCTGPSEDAPYTHFAVLSPPADRRTPEQQE